MQKSDEVRILSRFFPSHEPCDNILTLSDFFTLLHLWEVWNYIKNDKGFDS